MFREILGNIEQMEFTKEELAAFDTLDDLENQEVPGIPCKETVEVYGSYGFKEIMEHFDKDAPCVASHGHVGCKNSGMWLPMYSQSTLEEKVKQEKMLNDSIFAKSGIVGEFENVEQSNVKFKVDVEALANLEKVLKDFPEGVLIRTDPDDMKFEARTISQETKPDGGGLRFNSGKVNHKLLPGFAVNEVAKVFSAGSKKYGDWNWARGMPWSTVMDSLKRHINAYEQGEDFDRETGLLHMSHIATNALFLIEYYKVFPQGDDRLHGYISQPRIALDIDGVLADFGKGYKEYALARGYTLYPQEEQTCWAFPYKIQRELWEEVLKDKDFWLNLEPLCDPNLPFEPVGYVTFREVPSEWTEEWLVKCGFPPERVITIVDSWKGTKVEAIKELGADVFVDDNFNNFRNLNNAGITTYLFDKSYNRKYDVGFKRIRSLNDLVTGDHLNG